MGPVYLVQAMISLLSGVSFFREAGKGQLWFEQIVNGFVESDDLYVNALGVSFGVIITAILSLIFFPLAEAAVLLAINHLRKQEEYTVGSVIKEAFSRFGPIVGSSILFAIILFSIIFIPILMIILTGVFGGMADPIIGIILGIILFLGFAILIGYLITRWSFYFGSVVIDREAPGLTRSWRLTQGRTWILIGIYIIFYLINGTIGTTVEFTFALFLGNSVLLSLIVNVVSLLTKMLFTVGYAVMYLDLKLRNDADDLKEMIGDYKSI